MYSELSKMYIYIYNVHMLMNIYTYILADNTHKGYIYVCQIYTHIYMYMQKDKNKKI